MPERPTEPRYRTLGEKLDAATRELRDLLEAGTGGELGPTYTSAYLGFCEILRQAADAAEGLLLADLERAGRRRALTWREIGEARRTTAQAAHARGWRLMAAIHEDLTAVRTAAELGEDVMVTFDEALAIWGYDHTTGRPASPPNVRLITTTRTRQGEAYVHRDDRPAHWPKPQ